LAVVFNFDGKLRSMRAAASGLFLWQKALPMVRAA
jgi:hypothetical protein